MHEWRGIANSNTVNVHNGVCYTERNEAFWHAREITAIAASQNKINVYNQSKEYIYVSTSLIVVIYQNPTQYSTIWTVQRTLHTANTSGSDTFVDETLDTRRVK